MTIKTLEIKGLYGYVDKKINFFDEFNLLVGINGSGKTSVLNIISWLIKPSMSNLSVLEFRYIKMTFNFKNKDYTVICRHNSKTLKYFITSSLNEKFYPLTVKITVPPKELKKDESLKLRVLEGYNGLSPVEKEIKTWDLLKSMPDPTIIGLDRNLFAEESETYYSSVYIRSKLENKPINRYNSPIDRIKELINTEYRKGKNDILNLTNKLKNHLMLSAFEGNLNAQSVSQGIRYRLKLSQIEIAENRVKEYFTKFEAEAFNDVQLQTISAYFNQLKEIAKKYQESPEDKEISFLFGLNATQFIKINKLLKEFESFENESTKVMSKINLFLETVNYFFKDSSKELLFKEDTSEITFTTLNKNHEVVTSLNDIKFLSSGEQQLLILFSYLSFNSKNKQLFIIDEPELSLHIKWQEQFLEYLAKLSPPSTQVIIATHSPILVSKQKSHSILLLPYN